MENVLTPQLAEEFCNFCEWTYQVWKTRRLFAEELEPKIDFSKSSFPYYLEMIGKITYEYTIHQIVLLHDPAIQKGHENLSLEFVVKFGRWNVETQNKLNEIYGRLDKFGADFKLVRDKLLAHRDVKTLSKDEVIGEFEWGKDVEYFDALQEFVNVVFLNTHGKTFPLRFAPVMNDVHCFLSLIRSDVQRRGGEFG